MNNIIHMVEKSFKEAAYKAFEIGNQVSKEIENESDSEASKGFRMIASQNYFYAGEYGIKYLLGREISSKGRGDVFDALKREGHKHIDRKYLSNIVSAYTILTQHRIRVYSAYMGQNGDKFAGMRNFAQSVIDAIKFEDGE